MNDIDSQRSQQRRIGNTRPLQDERGPIPAGTEDHPIGLVVHGTVRPGDFDPHRHAIPHDDPIDQGVADDAQAGIAAQRIEIGERGIPACAVLDIDRIGADTMLDLHIHQIG